MTFANIRIALEKRLDAMAGKPSTILYENTKLTPPANDLWMRCAISAPEHTPAGVGAVSAGQPPKMRTEGVLFVDVIQPIGQGMAASEAMVDLVRAQFYAGLKLVEGSQAVLILSMQRAQSFPDGQGFIITPLQINFRAYS